MDRKNKKIKGVEGLVEEIESLKKSDVGRLVDTRIKEFAELGHGSGEELFLELCFCITTANCAADKCMRIQKEIGRGFITLPEKELGARLKNLGYRFHNRSSYLVEARKHKDILTGLISAHSAGDPREFLAKNVKGLGYKEASHFLRNIGYKDYAIIDFHIVDLLAERGVIERPKTVTKKKYLEIEEILKCLAERTSLCLAELDLYLWYLETGRILK